MNFKLNKIALALPISFLTLGAVATVAVDDIPKVKVANVDKKHYKLSTQKNAKNRYFVLLEDEPVALYQGNIKGLKATNIAASNGVNQSKNGKLNLQSSASVIYGNYITQRQNMVISSINSAVGRNVHVEKRFKIAINSLVVELSPTEVVAMRKIPGVLAVEKDELKQLLTDSGPKHVGATSIWENNNIEGAKGEGLIVGVMDTGIASYTSTVSSWQGISGFEGKAFHPSFADVGDDGYDHINPNGEGVYFGDCIESPHWCNDKVIGVISYDGVRTAGLWDFRADTGQDDHGHGTHVASTIAGNHVNNVSFPTVYPSDQNQWSHKYYDSELKFSISGVAPHANIISYKTCSVDGCWDTAAVESIEHAIANNVDVLNYSVGGGASSPWYSADSLALLAAREAGIYTAVAAGNSGQSGEKTVGSPGNSPWVTSVAALSHSRDFTDEKVATFTGGTTDLGDLIGKGATSGIDIPTDIVYAGNVEDATQAETAGGVGYCGDYSLPSRWDVNSIQGKVVICRRGGVDSSGEPLPRLAKGATALNANAAGMIFINEDDVFDNVVNDLHVLPTVHLNKEQGEALLEWLASGEGHQVTFTASELIFNDNKADITADFTSRGPDYFSNDYLLPDVGAPGVDILAGGLGNNMQSPQLGVFDKIGGEFRLMSGTSMASPHIAGMYVLMKAAQPTWTPAEAQSALMMTAYTDVKEDDDYDGEMNRADMHRTGSGSARVNLAINAGLVLNETRAGYEAADPLAEEMGTSGDINGWHGQPHQMNLPSLSKGECFLECSWTRTFKATKAGSWDVSFEYYNEGFTLEASETQFTVSEGEEIEIEFTAKALQGLNVKWTNGRVVLTPSDTSMPVQTLPAAINFIAGSAPAITEITAGRTNDSMGVKGITTIGTDNLQLSKSGLAKADIHEFELMRDASNNIIYHWDNPESPTIKVFPLNIQADSKRLVVEVLETTSPDLDIYIGIDVDVNGQPSVLEMDYFWKMSATETAFELIDEIDPRNDTYWVMVHNWAEGPAELSEDQMICEEGQEPDEGKTCAEAPIMDSVKLAITNVVYDEDNMTVAVPTSVAPREEIDTRVQWQQEMMEGDIYHGVFWLGTSAELNKNIGAVRVNMMRGGDDIKVSEPVQNDDKMSFEIVVAANNSQEDRKYDFSVEIAEGSTIANIVQDTVVEGASLQMTPTDVEYTINGNVVSWTHNQAIADAKVMFSVVLDIADVQGMIDATPVIESAVSTSEVTETTTSAMPVFVEGRPIFTASASSIEVKEGKPITLKANLVDGVIENPEISYSWRQISGTTVTGTQFTGQSITFNTPKVSSDETVVFELVGSNGSKTALPVQASFKVKNKSSGGSTGIFFLALSLLVLRLKRNN